MAFEFGMFHEFQRTVGVSDEEAFAASFEEIDAAERWRLDAMWLAEIHVNPFQVVRKNPSGADELVLEDTLLVPPGVGPDNNLISQQVNVWTRYTDQIGQFVLHCYILDHEDFGMLKVVGVVEPEALPLRRAR